MLTRRNRAARATAVSIPAPNGGLNGRDPIGQMKPTDALTMDNWFPLNLSVQVRNGYTQWATFTGQCQTLMPYRAGASTKVFAAVKNGSTYSIFDATSSGAVGAAVVGGGGATVTALTSAQFQYTLFGAGGGNYLIACNGADAPVKYDGATWTTVGYTGTTLANLSMVAIYKERTWWIQKNTFTVWYSGAKAINGALTSLDLSGVFKLGGALHAIVSWSSDRAYTLQDYIAFISTEGEIAIYQGSDPTSATTWGLINLTRVGRPIGDGRRCFKRLQSDVVILCADGLLPLSHAISSDNTGENIAVSDKIRNLINDDIAAFGGNFGWQLELHPTGNKFVINVPATSTYQYVMNTFNNSWCRFTGWTAYCFEVIQDTLWMGMDGMTAKADNGQSDNGVPITADCKQAFTYPPPKVSKKKYNMMRPLLTTNGSIGIGIGVNVDFEDTAPSSVVGFAPGTAQTWTTWGTFTNWVGMVWQDAQVVRHDWQSVNGIGYCVAPRLRVQALNNSASWVATDMIYEPAGLL